MTQTQRLRPAESSRTAALSPEGLTEKLSGCEEGRWTLEVSGPPQGGVDVYHYVYDTVDGAGVPVTATAALMAPRGRPPEGADRHPVVVVLHGTMPDKPYNLADLSGTNPGSERAICLAGVYASRGFIVVAPNYTGLDASNASHQSYMHAAQQTQDVLDALAAARELMPEVGCTPSEKLFLAGYSQGGWLTMATHREMEARGMELTASAPMSGPYALTAIVDDIFLGRPVKGSTVYMPLAIRAYQEAFGDVYGTPSDVYSADLADDVATLLPNETSHILLIQQGRLPATAVFSDRPVAPPGSSEFVVRTFAESSPARAPETFADVYALGFGERPLIHDRFRAAYLADIEAHPDGGWPAYGTGEPPARSGNGLRRAVIASDLRGWKPQRPLLMMGGKGDAATPIAYGGELMMRYWSEPHRAPDSGVVALYDFEAPSSENDPFAALKADFRSRKGPFLEAMSAMPPWVDAYHQLLLPRYCYTAARSFFQSLL